METSNSSLKCTSTSSNVNMSKTVSFASPNSPQIQSNTPSDSASIDGISKCPGCEHLKKELKLTKETWKNHCRSEVMKATKRVGDRYEAEKKNNALLTNKITELSNDIKVKQKLFYDANADLVKEREVNEQLIKENNVLPLTLERATDLILENKRYRTEAEEFFLEFNNLLQKSLNDVTCQTDLSGDNATNIIAHIEEVVSKKAQLNAAIARLLEVAKPSNSPASVPNDIHFIGENFQNSTCSKRRLERCDTLSPPSWEQNDDTVTCNGAYDSDIEFLEETYPQGPKAFTPEKNDGGGLFQPNSVKSHRSRKRRLLSGKENEVHLNGDAEIPILLNNTTHVNSESSNTHRMIVAFNEFLQEFGCDPSKTSLDLVTEFLTKESLSSNFDSMDVDCIKDVLKEYADDYIDKLRKN
uniref:Uncharacterized protein n=1 Tax=Meloidogyne enterolobii TaxID=390850 RepID=A0A6V7V7Y0_MELEN|nr:unnamed protein product [Meloidogyne enterolobii]